MYELLIAACREYEASLIQEDRDLRLWYTRETILAKSLLPWTGRDAKRRRQERIDRMSRSLTEVGSGRFVLEVALAQLGKTQQVAQGLEDELREPMSRLGTEDAPVFGLGEAWSEGWLWQHVGQYAVKNTTPVTRPQFQTWWYSLGCRCAQSEPRQLWIGISFTRMYEWLNQLWWATILQTIRTTLASQLLIVSHPLTNGSAIHRFENPEA